MAHLYADDEGFWTSEDGDEDEDDEEDEDETGKETGRNPPPPTKDTKPVGGEEATATDGATSKPTAPLKKKKQIQKKWAVEDTTDVSDFASLVPDPAYAFPFELDTFQKRAVYRLSQRESVFVAAHTSAGKTAVAEYAIAMALQSPGRRTVYTSPIKALSNQKFRDLSMKFSSVGIITGDVSLNPQASCLIMTTEILRTMLYRNDSLIDQIDTVIFDEVHYVSDADRGVVWEEVIILLPREVNLVCLSATVPNYLDFADWIGRTKKKMVFAVMTKYRPTPLLHYLHFMGKSLPVMDERGRFMTAAFKTAYELKREAIDKERGGGQNANAKAKAKAKAKQQPQRQAPRKPQTGEARAKTEMHRLQAMIKELDKEDKLPAVIFSFSRRRVESLATSMGSLDLTSDTNVRSQIHVFLKESLSMLSDDDKNLPQILAVSDLIVRGIGVHHGGLLPLVKEMVEIAFQRGLVRVLIATETFAMGINMPARSVVFTQIRKHDGSGFRYLKAAEYTQMAGRAGRRGIDPVGNVYIFVPSPDDLPDQQEMTRMMVEKSEILVSKFRLTYQMILRLAQSPKMRVEEIMARSFCENIRAKQLPVVKRDIGRRKKELESIPEVVCIFGEPDMRDYSNMELEHRDVAYELHRQIHKSKEKDKVFNPGRVVVVHSLLSALTSCWGAILDEDRGKAGAGASSSSGAGSWAAAMRQGGLGAMQANEQKSVEAMRREDPTFTVLVLLPRGGSRVGQWGGSLKGFMGQDTQRDVSKEESAEAEGGFPSMSTDGMEVQWKLLRKVPLWKIAMLSNAKLEKTKERLSGSLGAEDTEALMAIAQELEELRTVHQGTPPLMDLPKPLQGLQMEFFEQMQIHKNLLKGLTASKCHNCELREEHFGSFRRRKECLRDIEDLEFVLEDNSLQMMGELRAKIHVLEKLGFLNDDQTITLKGRVAAEVMTGDEIQLPELLFQGTLQSLEPAEVASMLSVFVFPDKCDDEPEPPTEGLAAAIKTIREIHSKVANTQIDCRLHFVAEDFDRSINFGLHRVAYQWATGMSFGAIMQETLVQEGSIVKAIQRLEELCRKVNSAGKLMGDPELQKVADAAGDAIRRDIVFAVSLYLK